MEAERERKNKEWRLFREEFMNDKLFQVKTEEGKEVERQRRRRPRKKEEAQKKTSFCRLRKMNADNEKGMRAL